MALIAQVRQIGREVPRRTKLVLAGLGVFGAALFFGDSMITPAISVLSAVEGTKEISSSMDDLVIPITVVRNGPGRTALFTGGNHGDEYEGPVALQDLATALAPTQVRGRVIIVPFMNFPAFRAGTRTSPIDRGNLNRAFPGRPDGTATTPRPGGSWRGPGSSAGRPRPSRWGGPCSPPRPATSAARKTASCNGRASAPRKS